MKTYKKRLKHIKTVFWNLSLIAPGDLFWPFWHLFFNLFWNLSLIAPGDRLSANWKPAPMITRERITFFCNLILIMIFSYFQWYFNYISNHQGEIHLFGHTVELYFIDIFTVSMMISYFQWYFHIFNILHSYFQWYLNDIFTFSMIFQW